MQKIARQQGKAVIAATTHSDLLEDLKPSVHVHKRFGQEIQVSYHENKPAAECSLIGEMEIEQGTIPTGTNSAVSTTEGTWSWVQGKSFV